MADFYQDILPIIYRVVVEKVNLNEVTNVGVIVNDENTDPNIGIKRYLFYSLYSQIYRLGIFLQKFYTFFYF